MKRVIITISILVLSLSCLSQESQRVVYVDAYQIVNKNLNMELCSRILPYMQEHKMDSRKYVIGLSLFSLNINLVGLSIDERATLSMSKNVMGVSKFADYDLIVFGEKDNKQNKSFVIQMPSSKKRVSFDKWASFKDGAIEWTYYIKNDSLILVEFRDRW